MKVTGLASGSLDPALARVAAARWGVSGKEDIDPVTTGRPARRDYTITGDAVVAATSRLAALREAFRTPVTWPALGGANA
jgi:PadR family transcriptional regulator PadR